MRDQTGLTSKSLGAVREPLSPLVVRDQPMIALAQIAEPVEGRTPHTVIPVKTGIQTPSFRRFANRSLPWSYAISR